MHNFRIIQLVTLTITLLATASLSHATPITFEFTGTVTNKVLSYGEIIDVAFNARKWKGKTITGTMHIDVEGLAVRSSSENVYYSSSYGDNPADWLSFTLTNPDGNTYSFPGDYDPLPQVDVSDATVYLIDSFFNGTHLYAGRTYSNSRSAPRQNLSLRLQARGPNDSLAISSLDLNTVEFLPEFANWENYGIVEYFHGNGKKFNYYFNINSITRVPQPSSWALILCGLAGLFFARRQHLSYKNPRNVNQKINDRRILKARAAGV